MICPACGCERGTTRTLKEYMFKTLEEFTYVECETCKTLYMLYPKYDLSEYYPDKYCGHTPKPKEDASLRTIWWRFLKGLVTPIEIPILNRTLRTSARILDFGSGSGTFPLDLFKAGFTRTRAIDKFIPEPISYYGGRLKVEKLSTWFFKDETFDMVVANHSLEPVPDPFGTLLEMKRILKPGGTILIRVPFKDSPTAEFYGEHWCGYDPPRHLVNFTRIGLKLLATRVGLTPFAISNDQQVYSFTLSELWKNGKTADEVDMEEEFGRKQINQWAVRCAQLNKDGQGDSGGIYMRKELE